MKKISVILRNLKNIFPYFLLIAIYFFFVNLEANDEKNKNMSIEEANQFSEKQSSLDDKQLKIKIPVIPFKD